jgi:hypothetical protein
MSEPVETNLLTCVIIRKTGAIEPVINGMLEQKSKLPAKGEEYAVGSTRCRVLGHAYTPHLASTWHLFLEEI